jgi:superfamily II DNA/RNA helicase
MVSLFCLPLPSIPSFFFQIQRAGFPSPTPIQAQSWPIALQNQDVVAIAKTGSGKTLGYLLPGFLHIKRLQNSTRSGPTVLVLAPTRELATQILEEAVKFGRSSRISSTVNFHSFFFSSWIICALPDAGSLSLSAHMVALLRVPS